MFKKLKEKSQEQLTSIRESITEIAAMLDGLYKSQTK